MTKIGLIGLSLGMAVVILSGVSGALTLGGAVLAAPSAAWYVNAATGDDGNDCLSPGTACATIGAAITKASAGDTIEIATGIYYEHDLEIYDQLALNGAGVGNTVIDGGGNGRLFSIGATVILSNLTVQNGQTGAGNLFTEGGGAIFTSGSAHLTLQNTVLANNNAVGSGGGIFNMGDLVLANTQILSNTAGDGGGGIYNYNLGVITVTNSTLAYNTSAGVGAGGGGIHAGGKRLTIQDSTLAHNSANYLGGGLDINLNGPVVLTGVTLSENQSVGGGGLFAANGALTMTNTTVSGNTATNNYGGIYISGPGVSLALINSTIAYNTRTNTSGTGYNGLMTGNNAAASLVNTILAYNQGRNCTSSTPPTSLGHNLSTDSYCGLTASGDLPGTDPLLAPLADYGGPAQTHALLLGSPAIDAADNSQCPAADARGIARPFDGDGNAVAVCDSGAVETRNQLSIADRSVIEGDSGTTTAVFTVTLSPASTTAVSVNYATADKTAISGSDYTAAAGVLTFNPGQTEKYINVSITGDTNDESDKSFNVHLSNPVNADLLDAEAAGLIIDDDGLPALSIADKSLLEGNSGTTAMQFEVTLSPASAVVVSVAYATANGGATAGGDYIAANGALTFQPGETSKTISVNVLGDVVDEGVSEDFTVQLSSPSNAALADGQAVGTITDDDEARLSQTFGPQTLEGNSGFTPAVFTVTLSTPADFTITADYAVSSGYGDDGAQSGEDFVPISGTLTFPPGATTRTYTVQIIGDDAPESDESYSSLINNANAPISANGSQAKILNDDDHFIYLPMIVR